MERADGTSRCLSLGGVSNTITTIEKDNLLFLIEKRNGILQTGENGMRVPKEDGTDKA